MTVVSWLHFSDWHQRGDEFDRLVTRDKLLQDIGDRSAVHQSISNINFVIFSGDLAYEGTPKEFEQAKRNLIDPILAKLNLTKDKIFFVPGNHDIDRKTIEEFLPSQIQRHIKDTADVETWLREKRRRDRVMEPFEAFSNFVESYSGQISPTFASRKSIKVDDYVIHILGLNSSWMCGRKQDDGRYEDERKLFIGEPQIHEALDWLAEGDLRIVVQHHPFEWLNRLDRDAVESRIKGTADFILWGHEHKPNLEVISSPTSSCVTVPAGACYDRRKQSDQRYVNSYNFVSLDLSHGRASIFFRRWSQRQTAWIGDTDVAPNDGIYSFPLPARITSGKAEASLRREASNTVQAGEIYRKSLLSNCDIIDLANLPGQDRLLAQRQLDLRRLFVPLHVDLEKLPTDERQWDEFETTKRSGNSIGREQTRHKIGERLASSKRIVILGDPGGGKTTLARWLTTSYLLRLKDDPDLAAVPEVQSLPAERWVPILIRCRDLDQADHTQTIDAMIERSLRKSEIAEDLVMPIKQYLRDQISTGNALVIIDGLDEVVDISRRSNLCDQIERFAAAHPDIHMVATSRVYGYRQIGKRLARNFEHLTLCDRSPADKEDFARRWCALTVRNRPDEAAADLIEDLNSSSRVQKLTGNPMLLTTMALVKRNIGRLPHRRAELYIEAVKALINWRNDQGELLESEEALPQLQYIAFHMCEKGVKRIRRDHLILVINEMRNNYPNIRDVKKHTPEEFIDLLEGRTGILFETGHERVNGELVGVYEFRHLTFQEFLAAFGLVKKVHPGFKHGADLTQRLGSVIKSSAGQLSRDSEHGIASWLEVIRLALTLCDAAEVDPVIDSILALSASAETDEFADLAGWCIVDEPNISDRLVIQVLKALGRTLPTRAQYEDTDLDLDSDFDLEIRPILRELLETRWSKDWIEYLRDNFGNILPEFIVELMSASFLFLFSDEDYTHKQHKKIRFNLQENAPYAEKILTLQSLMTSAFHNYLPEDEREIDKIIEFVCKVTPDDEFTGLMGTWVLAWLNTNYGAHIPMEMVTHIMQSYPNNSEIQRMCLWALTDCNDPTLLAVFTEAAASKRSGIRREGLQRLADYSVARDPGVAVPFIQSVDKYASNLFVTRLIFAQAKQLKPNHDNNPISFDDSFPNVEAWMRTFFSSSREYRDVRLEVLKALEDRFGLILDEEKELAE